MVLSAFLMMVVAIYAFADEGRSIVYRIDGKSYEGFFVDGGKSAPLILLVHDWDGLNDYEIKRSRMLNKLGYGVFAADLFGKGIRPEKMEDRQKRTEELYNDRVKMRALMRGALSEAEKMGADIKNTVAVGYCFGGAAVLELARTGDDLKGFVCFHGVLTTPEGQDYSKTRGKILILHGGADQFVSMDQFTALAKKIEAAKIDHEMVVYGGADHAFTVFGGERYGAKADMKSWRRFAEFLAETLKK